MLNALPEAAVERFRKSLLSLIDGDDARLGVAVSGGSDSLALLLLSHAAFPQRTWAATVDHGLRLQSADEADHISRICVQLSIPHKTLLLPKKGPGNVSDWARKERYRALHKWANEEGLAAILTGHHADDQLETILMRLNRGSGVAGLSGVRARNGIILRPVLHWRRDELFDLVQRSSVKPVCDPTNVDDRFDRARLRKKLATADWLDPLFAAQSAAALSDAEAALEWSATSLFDARTKTSGGKISLDPSGLPRELLRRLTMRCLTAVNPSATPKNAKLEALIAALSNNRTATLSGVRCTGGMRWMFTLAPPRRKI